MATSKKPTQTGALLPLSIARILWKQKWLIGLVWGAISVVTVSVVAGLPSKYRATAVLALDSQQIPEKYVSSTVVTVAGERLAAITQEIRSAKLLEQIIDEFDLYSKERQTRFREDILSMMKDDISTTTTMTGRTASVRVAYDARDPHVAANVANRLANLYVAENLKARATQSGGTSEFIEAQLKEAKQTLDGLEAVVSQYKLRHNGELPQQEDSLNGILARLGVALEANRDAINRAEQQRLLLQTSLGTAQESLANQIKQTKVAAVDLPLPPALAVPGPSGLKPRPKSEELGSQLAELKMRYSDDHPEVKRVQVLLAQAKRAEEQKKTTAQPEIASNAERVPVGPPASVKPPSSDSPQLAQTEERITSLQTQIGFQNHEIETRKREQQRLMNEMAVYQGRVNGLPVREQEMAAITRDYEASKSNYRSLQEKKLAADMSADMERKQQSERFTIVDPARVPPRPFSPKRAVLNIAGVLFGLALGVAVAFGKELHAGVFLGEWELPAGTTILGRLPHIKINPGEALDEPKDGFKARNNQRSRRWPWALVSSAVLSLLGIVVAGIYFVTHRN